MENIPHVKFPPTFVFERHDVLALRWPSYDTKMSASTASYVLDSEHQLLETKRA